MKNNIIILMLLLSFYSQMFAIDLGPNWVIPCVSTCVGHEYSYFFCKMNNGKPERETTCSYNANAEVGKKHIKHNMGFSIGSWSSSFDFTTWTMTKVGKGYYQIMIAGYDNIPIQIFNPGQISTYIRNVKDEWYNSCNKYKTGQVDFEYNTLNDCALKIFWSKENKDIRMAEKDGVTNLANTHGPIPESVDCENLNCEFTYLILNQQISWTKYDKNTKIAENFFDMYGNFPIEIRKAYNYYDFESVLRHEFGHFIGLPHAVDLNSCESYIGVMESPIAPYDVIKLSSDDECMYRKLYCCAETKLGIETMCGSSENQFDFNIFPNPIFIKAANISVRNLELGIPVEITIYAPTGQTVYTEKYNNLSEKYLNIDNIVDGVYTVEIKSENKKATRNIIIHR